MLSISDVTDKSSSVQTDTDESLQNWHPKKVTLKYLPQNSRNCLKGRIINKSDSFTYIKVAVLY